MTATAERVYRGGRFGNDQQDAAVAAAQPPHDNEAEQVVLGAMLFDGKDALSALRGLTEEDFYNPVHRHIFRAARTAYDEHRVVDLLTVTDALRVSGNLAPRMVEYLDSISWDWGRAYQPSVHLKRIRERTIARKLLYTADALVQQATEYKQPGPELVDAALAKLLEIRRESTAARGAVPAEQHLGDFAEWLYQLQDSEVSVDGFRWGLPTLDRALGGHAEDDLVLLKAATGMGKSTLLRQGVLETARYYRRTGRPEAVAVYLLEGGIRRWYQSAVAYLGNVEKKFLRRGGKRQAGYEAVKQDISLAIEELYELGKAHLLVSRDCRTVTDIVNDVREKLAGGTRFGAVCIDYLQLLGSAGNSLREKTVASMNALMALRSEVDFPLVLASQVTVQESGQVRAREAEDVEFGASSIIWLDRGVGIKNPDEKRKALTGKLITTKVRDDALPSDVELTFRKELLDRSRIGELAEGRADGPRQDY